MLSHSNVSTQRPPPPTPPADWLNTFPYCLPILPFNTRPLTLIILYPKRPRLSLGIHTKTAIGSSYVLGVCAEVYIRYASIVDETDVRLSEGLVDDNHRQSSQRAPPWVYFENFITKLGRAQWHLIRSNHRITGWIVDLLIIEEGELTLGCLREGSRRWSMGWSSKYIPTIRSDERQARRSAEIVAEICIGKSWRYKFDRFLRIQLDKKFNEFEPITFRVVNYPYEKQNKLRFEPNFSIILPF